MNISIFSTKQPVLTNRKEIIHCPIKYKSSDQPALIGPDSELVYAAFEPLGFPGPDPGLVFGR
jgi:hypothetical protein